MRLQFVGEAEFDFAGVDAGHVGAGAAIRLQAQVQAVVGGDLGDGRAGRIGKEALLAGSDAVNLRRSGRRERQRCGDGAGGKNSRTWGDH